MGEENTFHIGWLGHITRPSGEPFNFVSAQIAISQLAVDEINNSTDFLPNVTLALVVRDTHFSTDVATQQAVDLCINHEPPIVGFIGNLFSSSAVYEAQVAAIFNKVSIGYGSTSPSLSDGSRYPTYARTCPPDSFQGMCLADLVARMGWQHVNTLSTVDDYGSKCIEAFHNSASKLGIKVGVHRTFLESEYNDLDVLRTHAESLRDSGVNIFVVCLVSSNSENILNAADDVGLLEPGHAWVGSDGLVNPSMLAEVPSLRKAHFLGSIPALSYGNPESEQWQRFVSHWNGIITSGKYYTGGWTEPPTYGTYNYDAVYSLARSLEIALERALDPRSDGVELAAILKSIEFEGVTGHVSFNENGDRLGGYDIINTVEDADGINFDPRIVGSWRLSADESGDLIGSLALTDPVSLVFAGGSTVVPADRASASSDDSLTSIILPLLVAVVVMSVLFFTIFHRYRSHMSAKVTALEKTVSLTSTQENIIRKVMEKTTDGDDDQRITDRGLKALRINTSDIDRKEKLGSGAFGDVWRATFQGVECAVKCMLPDRVDEDNMIRFKAEMNLMRRLSHPNIIRLLGACWDPPLVMLVLELAEGGTLRNFLQSQRPPTWKDSKMRILRGIAAGVAYLHSLSPSVMHRDLKSENVLLDGGCNTKLSDFGASREVVDGTMTAVGSAFWMSPEVYIGAPYSIQCDVYSFAIVACEMIVTGGQITSVFSEIQLSTVPFRAVQGWRPNLGALASDVAAVPGLKELIEHCWQREPADRPSFVEIVTRLSEMTELDASVAVARRPSRAAKFSFALKKEDWDHNEEDQHGGAGGAGGDENAEDSELVRQLRREVKELRAVNEELLARQRQRRLNGGSIGRQGGGREEELDTSEVIKSRTVLSSLSVPL